MIRFVGVLFGGAAMAESKVGKSGLSVEEEEGLMRMMDEVKEKEGTNGLDKFIVNKMMDMEDNANRGDDFRLWMEANAIDSAKRINALSAKLCLFRGECGKLCCGMDFLKLRPALMLFLHSLACLVLWNGFPKAHLFTGR